MGGMNVQRHVCWQIVAADGLTYVGPVYVRSMSEPSDVQWLVNDG